MSRIGILHNFNLEKAISHPINNWYLRLTVGFFIKSFIIPHIECHSTFFAFETGLVPYLQIKKMG